MVSIRPQPISTPDTKHQEMVATRHPPRRWIYLLAALYIVTLGFNARQEAFGPADSGLRYTGQPPDHRPLAVETVVAGSPFALAGMQAGDVIETVDGRIVLGQTDWLLARAHLERNQPTEIQVRRGEARLRLTFTISKPNWTTWGRGVVAFQVARAFVLFLALLLAFKRPDDLAVRLAALVFAMIAAAEAFPSAGWAAALRHLPPIIAVPIALATVSWLLITVPWFSLCVVFPRTLLTRRWAWACVLAPVATFLPLMVVSAVAVVYRPAVLAMPTPFLDTAEIRFIGRIWGTIPSLFINPWPFYRPAHQVWLLELWVALSMSAFVAGYVTLVVACFRVREQPERRRLRMLATGLVMVWIIGIHNVSVRNWGAALGERAPALLSATGLVAEAIAFSVVVLMAVYTLINRPSVACSTPDRSCRIANNSRGRE
jgi:hypothetical protein